MPELDPHTAFEERIGALVARVHKMNDLVQRHEGTLREHSVLIPALTHQVTALQGSTATREQLDAAMKLMSTQIVATGETLNLKLAHLHNDLEPLKRAIYWAIAIVMGAVITALLSLIFYGPPHP